MTPSWSCSARSAPGWAVVTHRADAHADTRVHLGERPVIAVTLSGTVETTIGSWRAELASGTAWVEPAGERCRNRAGSRGARVLSIVPNLHCQDASWPDLRGLSTRPLVARSPSVALEARQLWLELRRRDAYSGAALAGRVLTLLARVARCADGERAEDPVPLWLARARRFVDGNFRTKVELATIAAAVGVTPSHLARRFRSAFGESIGEYVRRLRSGWAADALARGDASLAQVGAAAGYFDQSHFCREFRRRFGVTPAAYLRQARADANETERLGELPMEAGDYRSR